MLTVPKTQQNEQPVTRSVIRIEEAQEARPQYTYSDKMTLKEYLQQKNIQRNMQFMAMNIVRTGGSHNPMTSEREFMFEKQVHDIKGFVFHIMGEGSLFNRFEAMLDNLYTMFVKEITVYYKLRVDREHRQEDLRMKEFKEVNDKLSDYLKACQDETKKTQDKLEHLKKTKEFYQKEREKRLAQMKKKIQDQKKQAQKKQKERKDKEKKDKQDQDKKRKRQEEQRANMLRKQLFQGKKMAQEFKNLQQIQEYKKRKENIGQLKNLFG